MDKYKVLVVDDDPFARQLLGMFISQSENYEFAGTLISAALAEASVANRKVDLILMDVCTAMNANGIDAAEVIKKKYPDIKIIVITSQPEYSYITRARAVGVHRRANVHQNEVNLSVSDRCFRKSCRYERTGELVVFTL